MDTFDRMLRWRYNIDEAEFNRLLALQDGHCALCFHSEKLVVDHDHACCPGGRSCGECVRGLLCVRHNLLLGMGHDDPGELEAAAAYLRSGGTEHKAQVTDRPVVSRAVRAEQRVVLVRKKQLTAEQVQEIRASDLPVRVLAAQYDISIGTVSNIRTGKTRKSVR